MARAPGEIRLALRSAIAISPGTTRQLAARTQVGVQAAMYTLNNMVQAGEASKLAPVRVPGVRRPVPVYGPPVEIVDQARALHAAMRAWSTPRPPTDADGDDT